MKTIYKYKVVRGLLLGIGVCIISCTEPFEASSLDFEDMLIVEASITDELKQHDIRISRSYQIDSTNVNVSGASVYIENQNGVKTNFFEVKEGLYRSSTPFKPLKGNSYRLFITDERGISYTSEQVGLPEPSVLTNLWAERVLNDEGVDGVEIYVDGLSTNNQTAFLRYQFIETYRFDSFYKPLNEFRVISNEPPVLELVPKLDEERFCYITNNSNTILTTTTNNSIDNSTRKFPITFIERTNRKVRYRYSILVKQLNSSRQSFEFYSTLKNFSTNVNLFTQVQPGPLVGNIKGISNEVNNVIGLFELVSVSQQRIFFNYEDIFQDALPFIDSCESPQGPFPIDDTFLFERIASGTHQFVSEQPGLPISYFIAPINCIDCTLYGTAIPPDFWKD
ncbi:hypothetical protein BUL40_08675 [Croceivirga radicis]|uniref:DUF4249 domain-containing protein n=1 Tax=Croceivirga radicis TaxID=1929488 RepID=A0A1V6LSJ1_9FLAO|nr:DUF4249 domain-containing protein [Croceivirga radicis]OQD43151.1 hypothetical protein BUL40_08675 [Croceivirga radicis]